MLAAVSGSERMVAPVCMCARARVGTRVGAILRRYAGAQFTYTIPQPQLRAPNMAAC